MAVLNVVSFRRDVVRSGLVFIIKGEGQDGGNC